MEEVEVALPRTANVVIQLHGPFVQCTYKCETVSIMHSSVSRSSLCRSPIASVE